MKQIIQKCGMMALLLLSFLPAFAYDFEVDGIYYNITSMSNLEVEVTYNTSFPKNSGNVSCRNTTPYEGEIIIPTSVNYNNRTFSVVGIGKAAFGYPAYNLDFTYSSLGGNPTAVTNVHLPQSIRYIDACAFQGCDILSMNLPISLERIGNAAFANSNLINVTIPNGVSNIDDNAFRNSSISQLVLGNSILSINKNAFSQCSSLLEVFCTTANRPDGLSINTFSGGHSAVEIYVPSIANYGFGKEYITFPNNNYQYSGQTHNIEWSNNLSAYNCSISEAECKTNVNAGAYTKNLTATYSNGIDFSVEIPYTYTINKAPMNLTVQDAEREYGESNPAFTCNISGFVNGENESSLGTTPSFECEANQFSNVGTYRILASLDAPNYEITYKYGNLSILKAPLSLAVNNSSKIYGESNPSFDLSYSGLKNNETSPNWQINPTFKTEATQSSNVGVYAVSVEGGNAQNYDVISYSPGTLTILKKDLITKANNCERLYGEDNPPFSISYIGFANDETESDLQTLPTAECSATKESNAGTYPITVNGGQATNYNFVYQDGQLTIKPLTVGFKDVYNSVTYNDMTISTDDSYFNFMPEIVGPYNSEDFWLELWFLDKDNNFSNHVATISSGEYAGNYVNTNVDRPMYAGKYIFNLSSKGTNPNVVANPARAYLTVNRASSNFEWNSDSPIIVGIGEKVDLGITYQADLWCTFNTEYDEELLTLSSEGANSNNPHWFATGLAEGETTFYFSIECKKNDMGFYDFSDSRTLSKQIKVVENSGIEDVTIDPTQFTGFVVYNLQGVLILKTQDYNEVLELALGLYIVNGKKVYIR